MNERRRGFISGVLTTLLVLSLSLTVFAAAQTISVNGGVKLMLDGKSFVPTDVNGKQVDVFEYNGTTYVPVRAISQAYGKEVAWDGTTRTVIIGSAPTTGSNLLYSDANIDVTFKEVFEEPSVNGAFYIRLLIKNKTSENITILPSETSVNGFSTHMFSGMSMEIAPGNSSQTPFFIYFKNLDISSINELKNISFVINIMSESFSEIAKTEKITITF